MMGHAFCYITPAACRKDVIAHPVGSGNDNSSAGVISALPSSLFATIDGCWWPILGEPGLMSV